MAKIADLWRKSGKGKFKSKLPQGTKKQKNRRRMMAKKKTTRRRRTNGMYSNSKANIALGTLMAAAARDLRAVLCRIWRFWRLCLGCPQL